MTLKEAIEIKQKALDTGIVADPDDERTADLMSLEALKRFQQQRQDPHCRGFWRLPGETKEQIKEVSEMAEIKTGTWEELKIHPMELMKMVVSGKATIVGIDKYKRLIYEVKDEQDNQGRGPCLRPAGGHQGEEGDLLSGGGEGSPGL